MAKPSDFTKSLSFVIFSFINATVTIVLLIIKLKYQRQNYELQILHNFK